MKKIAYVAIIVVIVAICGYAIKVASERDKMILGEFFPSATFKVWRLASGRIPALSCISPHLYITTYPLCPLCGQSFQRFSS